MSGGRPRGDDPTGTPARTDPAAAYGEVRRPALLYTLSRLLLFVAALGLLRLAGLRGVLLFAFAVLVSGLASFWLLSRQRDAMSARLVGRVDRMRRRIDDAAASEDAEDEARRRAGGA